MQNNIGMMLAGVRTDLARTYKSAPALLNYEHEDEDDGDDGDDDDDDDRKEGKEKEKRRREEDSNTGNVNVNVNVKQRARIALGDLLLTTKDVLVKLRPLVRAGSR